MAAKFGELVVEMGFVTNQQIEEVIEMQKKGRAKLGQVLVNLHLLTKRQLEDIVTYQISPEGAGKKFGECAIEMKLLTEEKLTQAINYQKTSTGMLGEILMDLGYLTLEQRDAVIRRQLA